MKKNSRFKKGKLALLAVAGAALVASLVYDNKYKEENKANQEETPEESNIQDVEFTEEDNDEK